jgi:hypothetical protein
MPTIRGKRGRGPTKKVGAGRVSKGKRVPKNPTAASPGNLAPSGGILRWHGWRAPVMQAVGKIAPVGCTGTVIGVNLVLTAAHCLYRQRDDAGNLVCREQYPIQQIQFIPGGSATNPPSTNTINGEIWRVSRWWVPRGFKCASEGGSASRYLDWGIIEIAPNQGRQVGNVTGSYEAWWGLSVANQERLYIVGYPASGFWATANGLYGMSQYVCDDNFDQRWEDLDGASGNAWGYVVPCVMNGGASGGPWFVYHRGVGKWVIAGVSGWCRGANRCTPTANLLISRYLDDDFRQFWLSVKSQL